MKVTRAASIPLVTHDPYFSIWSSSDHLYDTDTVHWTGKRQQIRGYLTVDSAEEVLLDGGLTMPAYSIAFLTGK